MSAMGRANPGHLRFLYRTHPMPCPYLAGRVEQQVFGELAGAAAQSDLEALTRAGFRRSHRVVYRPACPGCSACVPVRVLAAEFAPGRSLRRIGRTNADLTAAELPPLATPPQHRLFGAYLTWRHGDSEMANMTFADYRAMVEDTAVVTRLIEFHDPAHRLVGVLLADWLADGLSAVYSFFDPGSRRRGVGNFMVLWLIERARRDGLDHVYLGYWIAQSPKMSYKTRFRPIEALGPEGWRRLERPAQPDPSTDRRLQP